MNDRLPHVLIESLAENGAFTSRPVAAVVPFFPATLRRRCRLLACAAGTPLLDDDASRPATYRLLRGQLVVRRTIRGEAVALQRAVPGDWLLAPEQCAAIDGAHAVCERASTLLAVPAQALADALEEDPAFARAWRREIEAHFGRLQRRVERLSLYYSGERIAHYLATESIDGHELILPFTKRIWAGQLGMAPETLSRALADMIANGTIKQTGDRRYRLRKWPRSAGGTP